MTYARQPQGRAPAVVGFRERSDLTFFLSVALDLVCGLSLFGDAGSALE